MLYRAYSCPMDLINRYINQGRFGTFVQGFLDAEYERRKQEAERDEEMMLWIAYIHSDSIETFSQWRKNLVKPASTTRRKSDVDLTNAGIEQILKDTFSH